MSTRGKIIERMECTTGDGDEWSIGTAIPATPENYETIMTLKEAVERMADRLEELTTPKNVERFLQQNARKLLPSLAETQP